MINDEDAPQEIDFKYAPSNAFAQHAPNRMKVYKCPSCAGALSYDPGEDLLLCASCGSSYPIESVRPKVARQLHGFTCPECGAELVGADEIASFSCPYCGNNEVAASKFEGAFEPDFIIPFKIDFDAAIERYEKFVKNRDYIPDDFLEESRIVSAEGTYVPFWLFSGSCKFSIEYQPSEEDLDTYHKEGSIRFKRVPADASTRMPNDMMDSLRPYDFDELEPFTTDCMPGFVAERYTEHYDETWNHVSMQVKQGVLKTMCPSPYRHEQTAQMFMPESGPEQTLLPAWLFAIEFRGERLLAGVNGQNGATAINLPIDFKKRMAKGLRSGFGCGALGALPFILPFFLCVVVVISQILVGNPVSSKEVEMLVVFGLFAFCPFVYWFLHGLGKSEEAIKSATQTVHSAESAEKYLIMRSLSYTKNERTPSGIIMSHFTDRSYPLGEFAKDFIPPESFFDSVLSSPRGRITLQMLYDFVKERCHRDDELIFCVRGFPDLSIGPYRPGYLVDDELGAIAIVPTDSSANDADSNDRECADRPSKDDNRR